MAFAPTPDPHAVTARFTQRGPARGLAGRYGVVLGLVVITIVSIAVRIALASNVSGPWIFMDELGYHRLAHSLADSGKLALFGEEGLSYSPLYSVVLAPIYGLGASAPTAYEWSKIVNAILMSLAVFPIYRIARFALPPRTSILVAGLSTAAPLMFYTSLAMSENLAYPLFLVAVWAMLVSVRAPSPRADAALLIAILVASAARVQLIVLYPIALTAVALTAALAPKGSAGAAHRILRSLAGHRVLLGAGAVTIVAAVAKGLAGGGTRSVVGRYADVGVAGLPSPWRVLESSLQHLAGLDLALGAIPLAGTIVAAHVLVTRRGRRDTIVFGSVAASATAWLLLEVGYNAAAFEGGSDLPRIHERYLIYVMPLFLIALFAAIRLRESVPPLRVYLAAAAVTALLPAAIPFGTVVNDTIVADSFGLVLLAQKAGSEVTPIPHAKAVAVCGAATLVLIYLLVRRRARAVAGMLVLVWAIMSGPVAGTMMSWTDEAGAVLPEQRDWVDRATRTGDVALVGGKGVKRVALLETAFHNLTITRLYYTCARAFGPGPEFGERKVSIDAAGRLRDGSQPVNASYAVVPAQLGLRGRVLARNSKGGLVLVAPAGGNLRARPGSVTCR